MMRAPFVAAILTLAAAAPAPAQDVSVEQLFARYRQRDPLVAQDFLAIPDAHVARRELERFGPRFLSGDRKTADERRRWLMTFALELAKAHSEKESVSAGLIVEWACQYVRRHEPLDEFDRRWQMAATAMLQGAINPRVLEMHLRHMGAQFPRESRLALARALVAEQLTAPREVLARGRAAAAAAASGRRSRESPTLLDLHEEAARRFQELAIAEPSLRAEANVRRARVYIWLDRHQDALLALDDVERLTKDPALVYLSRLFRGLALKGLGRPEDAQLAWVSALQVGPGAQSAMMSLATAMFAAGERAAADLMIVRMLERNDPRADPWWAYWAGDYRFWYQLISAVRELLP
jgi:tetratricopeptide (TPR) repeat protein